MKKKKETPQKRSTNPGTSHPDAAPERTKHTRAGTIKANLIKGVGGEAAKQGDINSLSESNNRGGGVGWRWGDRETCMRKRKKGGAESWTEVSMNRVGDANQTVCQRRTSRFSGPTADADVGVRPHVLRLHRPLPGILNAASAQNLFGSGTHAEEPQRGGQESFAPVFNEVSIIDCGGERGLNKGEWEAAKWRARAIL